MDGMKSKWSPVVSGIPQGSILGLLLIVIYINDMPEELKNYIQIFADDAKFNADIGNEKDGKSMAKDATKLEK